MDNGYQESRSERREKKREAQREKMDKHGKGMAKMYRDAILKRLGLGKKPPKT